jgi:hypothetical protein
MGTKTGEDPKRSHLEWLINRKLLAREAKKRGMHRDSQIILMVKWKEKWEVIKELYGQQVRNNIAISETELLAAFNMFNTEVRVRHLFYQTPEEAELTYQNLIAGKTSFEEAAWLAFQDSILAKTGGDLGFIKWGEMDPEFEKQAFTIKLNEISKPVRTKWGYHIIQVIDKRTNLISTESEFARGRSFLAKTIRKRKADSLAHEYIKQFMIPKNVRMKGPAFALLCSLFVKPENDNTLSLPKFTPRISEHDINTLEKLESHKNDILLTFEDGQWTVENFLQILRALPVNERPRTNSRKNLENDIGIVIRDEFLALEAYEKNLDKRPAVKKKVDEWQDRILAKQMWHNIKEGIKIEKKDIEDFVVKLPDSKEINYNDVREKILNQRAASAVTALTDSIKTEIPVNINPEQLAKIETIEKSAAREVEVMTVPLSN